MYRDLDAEGLAVAMCVGRASSVRREQERGPAGTQDEPQRALAERWDVDEKVAARGVEDDVLALVIERCV